jgi:PleD family two-component response regulator
MTLSAGLIEVSDNGLTADDLLRSADEALYAAKGAGRDRIVAYRDLENN